MPAMCWSPIPISSTPWCARRGGYFLLAQKTGQTNAFFFDAAGRQILSLDIRVEKDVSDLAALIAKNLPGSNIKVSAMNDNVVLSGRVDNAIQSTRAQDIAARFAGDPAKVVNMLQVAGSEQVMLKVRIAEMQRQVAKQFGIDLASAAVVNGVPIAASTSNPYGLIGQALSDLSGTQIGSLCPGAFNPTSSNNTVTTVTNGVAEVVQTLTKNVPCTSPNNVQGTLKALETVGLVHTLAEPNLTAVSGETAKFLAGGEFPVPTSRDRDGNVTVDIQAIRRRPFLHAGGAGLRPHLVAAVDRSQRTEQYRRLYDPAAARRRIRTAIRSQFRRRPFPRSRCAGQKPRSNCHRAAASPSPA